jgi:hypothetical protein
MVAVFDIIPVVESPVLTIAVNVKAPVDQIATLSHVM